jgi:hypothetical protein
MTTANRREIDPRSGEVYGRELPSGLLDLEVDDRADCVYCGRPAVMYALDSEHWQWFTCPDHHGIVMIKLLRGELDSVRPPL